MSAKKEEEDDNSVFDEIKSEIKRVEKIDDIPVILKKDVDLINHRGKGLIVRKKKVAKKPQYMVKLPGGKYKLKTKTNFSELPDSEKTADGIFDKRQAWIGLRKSWISYRISKREYEKEHGEIEKMQVAAKNIQEIQKNLGLEISHFDCLDEAIVS